MADDKRWTLLGLGVGAGLVYLLEPGAGRRRYHRARGVMAEVRRLLDQVPLPDDILCGRVRARLSRLSTYPHTLRVRADRGQVTVTGPILTCEAHDLIRGISGIAGVEAVVNELEIHDDPIFFPPDRRSGGDRRAWPPAARFAAAMAGGALTLTGGRSRGVARLTLAGVGLALLAGSLRRRRPRTVREADHVVSVHKSIDVLAPVDQVFELWTRVESVLVFLSGLRDVEDLGGGRCRWTVDGPSGLVSWDVETTILVPGQELSWRTAPGAPISHEGTVHFRATGPGRTRIDLELTYDPPGGALGHTVARLFGADPRSPLDDDLERLKAFAEARRLARTREAIDPPPAGA